MRLLLAAGACLLIAAPGNAAAPAAKAPAGAACQIRNIGGAGAATIFRQVEAAKAPISRPLAIGHGRTVKLTYDFTNQGNGTLQIANLLLRPYSESDSTENYQGHALDVTLFPDSVTGLCSIAVSGIVEETGEKDDAVVARRPAFAVYRYATSGRFVREVATEAKLFDLTK